MTIGFHHAKESNYEEVESHSLGGIDSPPRKEMFLHLVKSDYYYLIKLEDTIVGSFSFVILWNDTLMIQFLRIKEEYRDQGIGKDVVLFIEKIGKEKGCEVLMSTVLYDNPCSIAFHEKVGFKRAGNIEFEKEEIVFLKDINSSSCPRGHETRKFFGESK